MAVSSTLLYFWILTTIGMGVFSITLYIENREIKTVPVFIYAGPNVPQDMVDKISASMESFDEKIIEEWYKDRIYDRDFQMAMFYSYLSNALAEKAAIGRNAFQDTFKRDVAFKKSMEFWQAVVKKDEDLMVFRDYFKNKYIEILKKQLTNSQKVIK